MPRRFRPSRAHLALAIGLVGLALTLPGLAAGAQRAPESVPSRLAGIRGAGATGIMVLNRGDAAATAELMLHSQSGLPERLISVPSIDPGASFSVYLPNESSLSAGAYGVLGLSSEPLGLLQRSEWPVSGAVVLSGEAQGGSAISVPVWRNAGNLVSLVSIQNLDASAAVETTMRLRSADGSTVLENRRYTIGPGTSITLDLKANPDFSTLVDGFTGVLELSAASPIAVESIVDHSLSPRGTLAFNGVPDAAARAVLFAPRARSADLTVGNPVTEAHSSRIAVVNPGTQPVDVTVRYRGVSGACAGQEVVHGAQAHTLAAGGLLEFHQDPAAAAGSTGASGLPAGCAASARIEATGPISAAVLDFTTDLASLQVLAATGYLAVGADAAAKRLLAPVWRRGHTSLKLSSDLSLFNPGTSPAHVMARLRDANGSEVSCGAPCQLTVPPGSALLLRPEDTTFADNRFGSATIESDQPVVVLVEDLARGGGYDAGAELATGLGVSSADPGGPVALPLALNLRQSDPRTAEPPSPARISIVAFVDEFGGDDPTCRGCNGVLDAADTDFAATHPLPPIRFTVRDVAGSEVAAGTTTQLAAGIERILFELPPLVGDQSYTVQFGEWVQGWHLCANSAAIRTVRASDFNLGNTRLEYHFHTSSCVPVSPTPGGPTPIPTVAPPMPKVLFSTGIQAQQLGDQPADIDFDLADSSGQRRMNHHQERVAPEASYNFYLPMHPQLTNGLHSALVSSAGPLGVISLSDNQGSGTIGMDAAVPGSDLVVPLAAKGTLGLNTLLAIQNLDASAATEVTVVAMGSDGAEKTRGQVSVPAGAVAGIDLGRDPAFASLELGFLGSLRVRSATRIAVQAVLDFEHSRLAAAGFNGQPAVMANGTLFLPRVRSRVPADVLRPEAGEQRTRLSVVNPGTAETDLVVEYQGHGGTCAGQSFTGSPRMIPAGGSVLFEVADDGLPAGCRASARLEGEGVLLALALETVQATGQVRTAGAQNALGPNNGARRLAVPILRNQHVSYSTDLSIQNVSDQPVEISMRIEHSDGKRFPCGAPCDVTLAPGNSLGVAAEDIPGFQPAKFGWGFIEASGPVVAIVGDVSRSLLRDLTLFPALPPTGEGGTTALAVPLALRHGTLRRPGPDLTPYEPVAEPPGTSPLAGRKIHQVYLPWSAAPNE